MKNGIDEEITNYCKGNYNTDFQNLNLRLLLLIYNRMETMLTVFSIILGLLFVMYLKML